MRIAIAHARRETAAALRGVLAADAGHALAWTVGSGEAAIAACQRDRPDLLLLDLALPDIDTADATRRIMAASPCAILVTTGDAAASAPYRALAAGALDSVALPAALQPDGPDAGWLPLRRKLGQLQSILSKPAPRPQASAGALRLPTPSLLAIGASTGGPAVVAELLRACRGAFTMPCVVVQHIGAEFAPGMAEWLTAQTGHRVVLAEPGSLPLPGTVYLGAGPGHLVLDAHGRFADRTEPADYAYRPSIDEFFVSACALAAPGCALLLTGMGRDGARGLAALRRRGWSTLVQTPASCAAAGMPQAAIDGGAAQFVFDVPRIAAALMFFTSRPPP